MSGVPGQEQAALAEPFGHPVLHPDPHGPRQLTEVRVQARPVHQLLQFAGRDRRSRLPERQPLGAGRPGREQPPGCPLAEREGEEQALPPGHHVSRAAGQVEFGVREDDLRGVGASRPADAGLRPDRAGWPVAADRETEAALVRDGTRPPDGPHAGAVIPDLHQFGAALHLHSALGEGLREHVLHVHLPY